MPIPPWRELLERALGQHGDLPQARHVQLATVRPDGRPANRTVVFQGFLDEASGLLFTTDLRSAKAIQLAHNAWAEACWTFPEPREQFRLLGPVTVVGPEGSSSKLQEARHGIWRVLTDPVRQSFTWPTPGADRDDDEAFQRPSPGLNEPPLTFGLLVLEPHEVDHLLLRDTAHERHRYERSIEGRWLMRAVNP
ncbi:MAG TPA: pyridoxamine 5'-phosphate oxidase family protein [Isosphaeraceae bacterium]|jgi:PPOX class probable FMN-dependent enzyme|nr:pyridoxamine 5'-phosphate oxidase family protein [Isosphaeraceae bacterium]